MEPNKMKLGKYKHFKGKEYEVIGIGKHSETLEDMVIYKALYSDEQYGDGQIWVRPFAMFAEKVEVDGKKVPRFEYVEKALNEIKGKKIA